MQPFLAKRINGEKFFPVIESLHYDKVLKDCPLGTVVLITDPDHDRLTVCQIEALGSEPALDDLGVSYIKLDDSRILTIYSANQAFLMLMNYRVIQLKVVYLTPHSQ